MKYTIKYYRLFLLLVLNFATSIVIAQQIDTLVEKKNTIRFNSTNPLIFGSKSIIFGYERQLKKNRSFSIDIGNASLPDFSLQEKNDTVKILANNGEKGFHISADYRFYLTKENKYKAPRGLYIGPYYSYNYFSRSNIWQFTRNGVPQNITTELALSANTMGIEMGYQFVFWKKLALDFVLIGPGVGFYKFNAALNTSLTGADKELFFQKLNEYLAQKIPGYSHTINEGEFKKSGSTNTTGLGFRYMINIGFRF